MKTLKYLMLLLTVAIALPAMAQEEKIEKAIKVDGLKVKDAKASKVTEGTLSKNFTYTVEANGSEMIARVQGKNATYELVKRPGGAEKNCYADTAAICPTGFVHMKKDLDVTNVLENFLVAESDFEERAAFSVRDDMVMR